MQQKHQGIHTLQFDKGPRHCQDSWFNYQAYLLNWSSSKNTACGSKANPYCTWNEWILCWKWRGSAKEIHWEVRFYWFDFLSFFLLNCNNVFSLQTNLFIPHAGPIQLQVQLWSCEWEAAPWALWMGKIETLEVLVLSVPSRHLK